jgi:hypothetical protein
MFLISTFKADRRHAPEPELSGVAAFLGVSAGRTPGYPVRINVSFGEATIGANTSGPFSGEGLMLGWRRIGCGRKDNFDLFSRFGTLERHLA